MAPGNRRSVRGIGTARCGRGHDGVERPPNRGRNVGARTRAGWRLRRWRRERASGEIAAVVGPVDRYDGLGRPLTGRRGATRPPLRRDRNGGMRGRVSIFWGAVPPVGALCLPQGQAATRMLHFISALRDAWRGGLSMTERVFPVTTHGPLQVRLGLRDRTSCRCRWWFGYHNS